MEVLRDLRYRQLTGAVQIPKARVVFADGTLHIWSRDGTYSHVEASAPRHVDKKTVVAEVDGREVQMKRCCGCGMPMRIRLRRDARNLLATQRKSK